MNSNKYSDLKIVGFPDKLAAMKAGRITAPIYVRVKPINFCNHHCVFCLFGNTVIATISGPKQIKDITVGNLVYGPDNQCCNVKTVSSRKVNKLLRISTIFGHSVETTEEHPFLTQAGWVKAGDLVVGNHVAVRMASRRGASDVNSRLEVGGIKLESGLKLVPIGGVQVVEGEVEVYNFSCEPSEAYEANGFVVHNCSYHEPQESKMHTDMNDKDKIPVDKMFEILDDFFNIGVKAVTYSGGGEPLAHKHIVQIMERTLRNGIDLSIITHGQFIEGERATALSSAKWVRVSMDYTTSQQLANSRRIDPRAFDIIMGNLAKFSKIKKPGCDLAVNYIVQRENYEDLVGFAKKLKDCGVNNVRFSPVWYPNFQEYHAPIAAAVEAQLKEAQSLCDNNFSINTSYDLHSTAHAPVRAYHKCAFMQIVPVVGADLNVYSCHNKAYDPTGKIGSIKDRKFSDLWFSDEAKARFEELDPTRDCKHQCSSDSKNRVVNALLETHHDNFV